MRLMIIKLLRATFLLSLWATLFSGAGSWGNPLKVSSNGRYLVQADGEPFFYLGATGWELFHRLTREEVDLYLKDRVAKGFTVVQAVLLAEEDGLRVPNVYGHTPLVDMDPARPATVSGADNDYWDHVDYVFDKAESLGLILAILPTWGDKWNLKWGVGPVVFTEENAHSYGKWLAERYGERNLIWVLGGDRPIETETHRRIVIAMADGIKTVDKGRNLMTYHPSGGGRSSSEWFRTEDWLDFNMMQTGPNFGLPEGRYFPNYTKIEYDYGLYPVKPCMDSEPGYENAAPQRGTYDAACVRRWSYWSVFAGGHGVAYGAAEVWQFSVPGVRGKKNGSDNHWKEALDYPGAHQMVHIKRLMMSRPMLERVPDQSLIVGDPGEFIHHIRATRGESYAMFYIPTGRSFVARLGVVSGEKVKAWWFDPKTGDSTVIGVFDNRGEMEFDCGGLVLDGNDHVLVLDDLSKGYPAPGTLE